MKKKHCSVMLLLLSVLLLAGLTGCGNKEESTNSASVPSYSSGDTASLPAKEVEEKNETAGEPESNDTSLEKEPAPQKKEDATSLWNEFLTSGNYSSYIGDQSTASLEYVITDLNADVIPELLIQSTTEAPFMTTWTFVLNNTNIVLANEMYGYGSFRYSPSQNAVIGSPECRPFQGTGWSPFYQLEGTELKYKFQVGEDGQSYYSDDSGYKNISDDERASYYADAVDFDWSKISSSEYNGVKQEDERANSNTYYSGSVTLTGIVDYKTFEHPNNGSEITVSVLRLDEPVDLFITSETGDVIEHQGVDEIQLKKSNGENITLSKNDTTKVQVTGELAESPPTAYYLAEYVVWVDTIDFLY